MHQLLTSLRNAQKHHRKCLSMCNSVDSLYILSHDSWSISQAHTNSTRAQRCLAISHYRIGVSTQSTLRGVKHFNNTPTITPFIHHHGGIRRYERNENIKF